MKKNIILVFASVLLISILAGCSKNVDIPNFNTITVTFSAPGPKYLTGDVTVNPKDSIQFKYAVSSPSKMKYVYLMKNGTPIATDTVKTGDRLSFSAIKKIVADTASGSYAFAVVARDTAGVYLGTSSLITVTVTPDFNYYINRTLFVPDSTSKTNPCYISLATGTVYSYKDVSANAATISPLIDLEYYYRPDSTQAAGVKKVPFAHFLSATNFTPIPAPISMYDISAWTKNNITMKIAATPTFASVLSGGGIASGCATNLKTGATNSVPTVTTAISGGKQTDTTTPLASGNVIWFKTAAGKNGLIQIDYINQNSAAHGTYMTVDIKIQK